MWLVGSCHYDVVVCDDTSVLSGLLFCNYRDYILRLLVVGFLARHHFLDILKHCLAVAVWVCSSYDIHEWFFTSQCGFALF